MIREKPSESKNLVAAAPRAPKGGLIMTDDQRFRCAKQDQSHPRISSFGFYIQNAKSFAP